MEKASIQVTMSSIFLRDRLGLLVRIIRQSKTSFGSYSDWAMLACNKSLNSTNFPATIWPTSFAGTGAKLGPMTKRSMQNWKRVGDKARTQLFQRHDEGGFCAERWCRNRRAHNSSSARGGQNRSNRGRKSVYKQRNHKRLRTCTWSTWGNRRYWWRRPTRSQKHCRART